MLKFSRIFPVVASQSIQSFQVYVSMYACMRINTIAKLFVLLDRADWLYTGMNSDWDECKHKYISDWSRLFTLTLRTTHANKSHLEKENCLAGGINKIFLWFSYRSHVNMSTHANKSHLEKENCLAGGINKIFLWFSYRSHVNKGNHSV